MKKARKAEPDKPLLRNFLESSDPVVSFVRDIAWVAAVVGGIALLLFIASGTWPAIVAVESESMVHNMEVGDIIFLTGPDRSGEIQSMEEASLTGFGRFISHPDRDGNPVYGDVIVYRPNGDTSVHPIIHRAVRWVDESDGYAHAGYITKGDNNPRADQGLFYRGIGVIEPVKPEWVIGKAIFGIPLVGYLPLHIVEFAAVLIAIMIIYELIMRRRGKNGDKI